ncbi:Adaptive-response sensory-kinase SasA [subsurface metagenome]
MKEERALIDAVAERLGRITERIQAEEALRSSEEWLSTTLRSIGDAVIATDEKACVKLMNPVAQALTGWNEKDAVGKPLKDVFNIFNEETGKQAEVPIDRIIREGIVVGLANHTLLIAKDGTKRSIDDSGAPIRDYKGNIIGTTLIFRDVTEKRQLERHLNERVKELRCLYGIADIAERPGITLDKIYQETVKLVPTSWQYPEVACAQLNIDGKEFKTANYRETEWKQSADIKVKGIKAGMLEIGYLEERPASDEGPFLKEERALIDAVAERLGRITERIQAEEHLRRLNRTLLAIRNVNQLITRESDAGKLLKGTCDDFVETQSCYHSWSVLLDHAMKIITHAEAGLGEDFSTILSQAEAGHLPTCCQKALGQAEVVITENPRSTCADCTLSHRCEKGVGLAVSLKYGDKSYGFLCVCMPKEILSDTEVFMLFREAGHDISLALRNLELEAERDKMDELKDSLIGMVSHELRTPLTVVIAAVKTAIDERISNEERQELLQEAVSSSESLSVILDNLLELSRHQAGRLTLDKKQISVAIFVEKAFDRVSRQGLTHVITLDIPDELPPVVADAVRLEQILYNLVENAIKYSPKGSQIQVFARRESKDVVIGVTDHGIGVAPEDQKRIFEPFNRLEQIGTSKGIGLGLVVCKQLVEAHSGRIWVESKPGEGSTFLFTIPLQ